MKRNERGDAFTHHPPTYSYLNLTENRLACLKRTLRCAAFIEQWSSRLSRRFCSSSFPGAGGKRGSASDREQSVQAFHSGPGLGKKNHLSEAPKGKGAG